MVTQKKIPQTYDPNVTLYVEGTTSHDGSGGAGSVQTRVTTNLGHDQSGGSPVTVNIGNQPLGKTLQFDAYHSHSGTPSSKVTGNLRLYKTSGGFVEYVKVTSPVNQSITEHTRLYFRKGKTPSGRLYIEQLYRLDTKNSNIQYRSRKR
jgi:hypothetical protein